MHLRFILAGLLFFACSTFKKMESPTIQPEYSHNEKLDLQGHRGCRGLLPENTWPAMKRALDIGVTTLEMDVVITGDNQVLVSHEPWFNHEITTKPDGSYISEKEEKRYNIYKMPYTEIKQYDVGLKPHPRFPKQTKMKAVKPLLSSLFDSIGQYMKTSRRPRPFYNIEIKTLPGGDRLFHPAPADFVELLMPLIKARKLENEVTLQSFDVRPLQYLHQHYPTIKTALLIEDYDKRTLQSQVQALGFVPAIYSPHYSLVTGSLLQQCRQLNMKVIPWTVNDKATMDQLIQMGVDGIITDYPTLFFEKK